jgi:hypothetical protein
MATPTRSFPIMSNEPSDPDAAPRLRGFVRRNWLALVLFIGVNLSTPIDAKVSHMESGGFIDLSLSDGYLDLYYGQTSSGLLLSLTQSAAYVETDFTCTVPSFGGLPILDSSLVRSRIALPLWLFAAALGSWIAFREWRRKRAAKGKAGPG